MSKYDQESSGRNTEEGGESQGAGVQTGGSSRRAFNRQVTGAAVLLSLGSQGAWASRGVDCMSAAVWASFSAHSASYGPGAGRQARAEAHRFEEFERGREYRQLFRRRHNGRDQVCYREGER